MNAIRVELGKRGRLLGTRSLGVEVRQEIEKVRAKAPDSDIVVDFAGVEVVSVSFADEVFTKLTPSQGPVGTARRRLTFANLASSVRAVLVYVLSSRTEQPQTVADRPPSGQVPGTP